MHAPPLDEIDSHVYHRLWPPLVSRHRFEGLNGICQPLGPQEIQAHLESWGISRDRRYHRACYQRILALSERWAALCNQKDP